MCPMGNERLKIVRAVLITVAIFMVTGCVQGMFMRAVVRGGIAEGIALRTASTFGGHAGVARVIAQSNIGAVVLAEHALGRVFVARAFPLELRAWSGVERGKILVSNGQARVSLGGGEIQTVRTGHIAKQYDIKTGKQISYSRYSQDFRRMDYSIWDEKLQKFEHILYGLRNPRTGGIAFFGKNHSYLGRAILREVTVQSESSLVIAGALSGSLVVELQDYESVPERDSCSDELVLVRRTYFNQGELTDSPDYFWDSLFKDCPNHPEVRQSYAQLRLDKIMLIEDKMRKQEALSQYLKIFPESGVAHDLFNSMGTI